MNCTTMKPEETPVEPGCYRLEDIQRATPMTCEELVKRDADIRREMEEQIRAEIRREMMAEQEVKKQLLEQKKKEQDEQKQLDELYEEIRKADKIDVKLHPHVLSVYNGLIASGHKLLFWLHCRSGIDGFIIVTQKGVFHHIQEQRENAQAVLVYHNCISEIYTFTTSITMQQIKLISNIAKVANQLAGYKKFESVIRLIPGSYSNGAWKQLDGFFGAYFNEETMEISTVPPPM